MYVFQLEMKNYHHDMDWDTSSYGKLYFNSNLCIYETCNFNSITTIDMRYQKRLKKSLEICSDVSLSKVVQIN